MSDVIGDDDPIPLAQAASVFFHGALTKSALRTEARKGNLEIVRIANKDFVTRNAIRSMINRCKFSSPAPEPAKSNHISAQEAVREVLAKRKQKRTRPGSYSDIDRPNAFTPQMLADRWDCSERHVRNMIKRGDIRSFLFGGKLVRISSEEVDRFERSGGSPAQR